MATGKDRETREARERARVYQARQELHETQQRRRTRDNLLAGVVGGVIVLAAIGAQVGYFTVGPGAPEPTPAPSASTPATPSPSGTPAESPAPGGDVEPGPTPTP